LTTATANQIHLNSSASTSTPTASTPVPLYNIEAQWQRLSNEEKLTVHEQLEGLQVKDWKALSLDEKKAGQ